MWMDIHMRGDAMKSFQMTLDEDLVRAVDQVSQELGTSRSAFAREALRDALRRPEALREEARHRRGYAQRPVAPGEFSAWESEQAWGEE